MGVEDLRARGELNLPNDFNRGLSEEIISHAALDRTPAERVTRGTAARIDRFKSVHSSLGDDGADAWVAGKETVIAVVAFAGVAGIPALF